ncbi:MAG TPA: zinc ABC transporter substrate-binding protein [Candidatus Hydrogenedentes bacterium]|nr:zinc ABC transporter substrate-binding protein [Candidatus Hydrogenedentota bacterium]HPO29636.1 zinc ABC transporter substrate-binding protein [Candidatus Hydrogenedentota bacterium]
MRGFMRRAAALAGLACWILASGSGIGAEAAPESHPVIGVGSAHLREVVLDLGFAADQVVTLVPPAQCPGHFDVSPSEISALAVSRVLLVHPWQRQLSNLKRAIDAAGVRDTVTVDVPGNWMVPDTLAAGVEETAATLAERFGDADVLRERARRRAETVRAIGKWFRERVRTYALENVPVLCQGMQEPCARWAGLRVVAVFDRAEAMGADAPFQLIQSARTEGVKVVVDNLQSGDDRIGARLAGDLSVPRVVWSNFPGAFPGFDRWEDTVAENLRRLAEALGHPDADFTGYREAIQPCDPPARQP